MSYYYALRWQKARNEISVLEMWTRSCKFGSLAVSSSGNLMNFLICVAGPKHPVFGVGHCLNFMIPMAMIGRYFYFDYKFELDVKTHKKYLKKVMLFHLVEIVIVTIFNQTFRTEDEMYLILISEILSILVTSWWTASYFTVCVGGIKIKENRNRGTDYEPYDADSDDDDSSTEDVGAQISDEGPTSTKCRICLNSYDGNSKKRTPLTLHGCGHTVCYGCAQKLLKKTYIKISCPFCRKNTMIHSVKQLTKNYGMLELIEELRKN
ncbi:unnamed protein product [Caenorhabditis brenneri]